MARLIGDLGGIASTGELRAHGLDAHDLRIAHDYGCLRRVRRGWYAHNALPLAFVHAWAWGGLLTCASAQQFLRDREVGITQRVPALPLHICVRRNSPTPSRPLTARGTVPVIIHWETIPEHDDIPDRRSPRRLLPSEATIARHRAHCAREREPHYCRVTPRAKVRPVPGWLG